MHRCLAVAAKDLSLEGTPTNKGRPASGWRRPVAYSRGSESPSSRWSRCMKVPCPAMLSAPLRQPQGMLQMCWRSAKPGSAGARCPPHCWAPLSGFSLKSTPEWPPRSLAIGDARRGRRRGLTTLVSISDRSARDPWSSGQVGQAARAEFIADRVADRQAEVLQLPDVDLERVTLAAQFRGQVGCTGVWTASD